jgi:lipoprotein-anchoring transpeptidase ErfK/SrfK
MTGVWRAALLGSVAAFLVAGPVGTAHAQFWQSLQYRQVPQSRLDPQIRQDGRSRQDTKARKSNRTTAGSSKKDVPIRHPFGESMPKGPLQLMVSINDQRAVLYSNGVRVADSKVSSGTASHPTPTGIFSIIQKNRWHRSNLYGAAPMFYMHRLTWSGIALHEGHLPGFAASHGCIRMPTEFVSRLWNVSKLGMRVVVARSELTPQELSHAKLFNPALKPIANSPRTSDVLEILRPSLDTTGQGPVRVAEAEPPASSAPIVTDASGIAPAAADVAAEISSRQSAATAAAEASGIIPSDAGAAATTDRAAAPVESSPLGADAPAAASDVATTPIAPPATGDEVTTSTVQTPAAETPATPAAATTEPARPAIDPSELRVPRPAPLRVRAAEPTKRNGQVAVFISGKEKRIYVRHAFVPVFDMPIEIANPGKSLGTHTFTALEVVDDGKRMRWNVISMPLTAGQPAAATAKKGGPKQQAQPPRMTKSMRGVVVTSESSSATEALDRVTIPQEAIDRIADLLTPGSSLIITDEGLGRETGRYTEFIVETR